MFEKPRLGTFSGFLAPSIDNSQAQLFALPFSVPPLDIALLLAPLPRSPGGAEARTRVVAAT